MRAGARKVVSDSDNRVMSLIIGYRRSRTESEKRDNSVIRHPFPPGGAAQKREVGENNIWATWPLLARSRRILRCSKSSVIENAADDLRSRRVRLSMTQSGPVVRPGGAPERGHDRVVGEQIILREPATEFGTLDAAGACRVAQRELIVP